MYYQAEKKAQDQVLFFVKILTLLRPIAFRFSTWVFSAFQQNIGQKPL